MHDINAKDEELMAQYQLGSEEAFLVLYQRHSSKIFGYVCSRVRDRERANDVFQEIFSKMHRSKHLYNQSLPFLPWLFSISRSVTVDFFRSESMRATETVRYEEELMETQAIETPQREIRDLKPHIVLLPDAQRAALEMRYIDEKTFDEIASALNTSPLNARKLISRGVKRLKELIQEETSHERRK